MEEVEPLPEDYYTRPVNLTEGNSLACLCHISVQADWCKWSLLLFFKIINWDCEFSELPVLWTVTTLKQRLLQPDFQPICASQLYPRHKHLLIKRSLRCRVCSHNKKTILSSQSLLTKLEIIHKFQNFPSCNCFNFLPYNSSSFGPWLILNVISMGMHGLRILRLQEICITSIGKY